MTGRMRKNLVDRERLKVAAGLEGMRRLRDIKKRNRLYYLTAIVWATLAALPSAQLGRPLPFILGSAPNSDIHSRVTFTWHDAASEGQAVKNMENTYARRYRETPLAKWAGEVYGPVEQLLARTAVAYSPAEVSRAAGELSLNITSAQADGLWRGASVTMNDPYHYLINPLKEVLEREVFTRGIMDPARFEVERGRDIQIIRDGNSYITSVGSDRGPVTATMLGPFLEQRFAAKFSTWLPAEFRNALKEVVEARLKPTLAYDEAGSLAELGERKNELLTKTQEIKRGDLLARRGEPLSKESLSKIREEDKRFIDTQDWRIRLARFAGNYTLFIGLAVAMAIYFRSTNEDRQGSARRFLSGSFLCLLPMLFGYWLIWMGLPGTLLPIGLAAGIAALGMSSRTAVFLTALSSLGCLVIFEGRADLMVGYMAAGWLFVYMVSRVRWRALLILTALLSGLVGVLAFLAWNLARGDASGLSFAVNTWRQALSESHVSALASLAFLLLSNWLVCGVAILAIIPLVERFFGVTTRIHLQDLASQEHPLIKRMILEAPGTYHHSTIVSTLAEAGAEAIGADSLRARIGGMFHDIGKLVKPEYFTENEAGGLSRHDNLSPNMSALVIINHVKDGAEMARAFKLPAAVLDMILQHHGTSLMKYFHHRAVEQAPAGTAVDKAAFTYPGPRPQSREAGIVMLADAVEAAVRSLDTPSPQHLKNLISGLARDRLMDYQFEDSSLTMDQLAKVERVFLRLLISMHHIRVKYPGQEEAAKARKRGS